MRVVEFVGIEGDELADQAAKGGTGRGMDRGIYAAEKSRQIVCLQSEPRDDAEAASAAALEPPEKVRVGARIGDPHQAVCSDDFGFQEVRGSGSKLLRKATESAGLHKAGDADRQTPPTLHIAATRRRHLI